jgi:hypothetical protein
VDEKYLTQARALSKVTAKLRPNQATIDMMEKLRRLPRFEVPPSGYLPDEEEMKEIEKGFIESRRAPLVTRDALLALLEETRTGAKRDRWIIGFSAGSLLVSAAALFVALF